MALLTNLSGLIVLRVVMFLTHALSYLLLEVLIKPVPTHREF